MSENEGPRKCLAMSAVFDVPRSWTGCADDKLLEGGGSKVNFNKYRVRKISWVRLGHIWLDCSSSDKTAIPLSPR